MINVNFRCPVSALKILSLMYSSGSKKAPKEKRPCLSIAVSVIQITDKLSSTSAPGG